MGLFQSPTPPGVEFRHGYRLVRWRGATRVLCGCGWRSEWMAGDVAAQFEADRHAATGSATWAWT